MSPERGRLEWSARTGAITAAVLAVGTLLFTLDPAASHVFPPCPVHWLSGLNCPGCGSLRAIHCLLHGRLGDAFAYNPLLILSLPLLAGLAYRPSWAYRVWVPWATFAIVVAYGILRNLPGWPFPLP